MSGRGIKTYRPGALLTPGTGDREGTENVQATVSWNRIACGACADRGGKPGPGEGYHVPEPVPGSPVS